MVTGPAWRRPRSMISFLLSKVGSRFCLAESYSGGMDVPVLGDAGQQLWDSVTADYELSAGEFEVLRQACFTADEIEWLRNTVIDSGEVVVKGSTGQPRSNPAFASMAEHRRCLATLMAALNLPSPEERDGQGERPRMNWATGYQFKGREPGGGVEDSA
jgi:hypothetical protein